MTTRKKKKTVYVCSQCGAEYLKWQGKCTSCGEWDSLKELKISPHTDKTLNIPTKINSQLATELNQCKATETKRIKTGFNEFDKVLGDGIVEACITLISGAPGIGKSTFLLQIAAKLTEAGQKVLYVSGEESKEQIYLRAKRLGLQDSKIILLCTTVLDDIFNVINNVNPNIVIIDSIQTIWDQTIESPSGSITQVRKATSDFISYAKQTNTSFFIVGHITKDGAIAGPKIMEHMVDTVIYFEGDSSFDYRIVRSGKNRFGPSGEIALFDMKEKGLVEIINSASFFIDKEKFNFPGVTMSAALLGSRIFAIEIQALVSQSHFGMPQRVASGISQKKLSLILAIIEKHTGIILGDHDVFINIAGGLNIMDPATDLAIAAALYSSFLNKPIKTGTAFLGEIDLAGNIRLSTQIDKRIKELSAVGIEKFIVPNTYKISADNINIIKCKNIKELKEVLF